MRVHLALAAAAALALTGCPSTSPRPDPVPTFIVCPDKPAEITRHDGTDVECPNPADVLEGKVKDAYVAYLACRHSFTHKGTPRRRAETKQRRSNHEDAEAFLSDCRSGGAAVAPSAWAQLSDLSDAQAAVKAINANTAGVAKNGVDIAGVSARTTNAETAINDLEMAVKTLASSDNVAELTNQLNALDTLADDVDDRADVLEAKLDAIASTEDVKAMRSDIKVNAMAVEKHGAMLADHVNATNTALADHDLRIEENTAGVAAAMALTSIPDAPSGKMFAVGLGTGFWKGETAFAIGTSARFQSVGLKLGVTGNKSGVGVGAGASIAF